MAKPAQSGWELVQRAIRAAAILLGGACTLVTFASLVGVATGNAWARAIVALLLTGILPAVAVDRALPRGESRARPGLVGDVVALVLLAIPLLFVGVGQPVTRPLLVREGDRLAEDGRDVPAHVVYFLAGVRPVDAPAPAAAAAPSALPDGGP
jgi:hypothetical protein